MYKGDGLFSGYCSAKFKLDTRKGSDAHVVIGDVDLPILKRYNNVFPFLHPAQLLWGDRSASAAFFATVATYEFSFYPLFYHFAPWVRGPAVFGPVAFIPSVSMQFCGCCIGHFGLPVGAISVSPLVYNFSKSVSETHTIKCDIFIPQRSVPFAPLFPFFGCVSLYGQKTRLIVKFNHAEVDSPIHFLCDFSLS